MSRAMVCLVSLAVLAAVAVVRAEPPPVVQREKLLVVPRGAAPVRVTRLVTTAGDDAPVATAIALSWDERALSIVFDCTDDRIVARDRERDDPEIWKDDTVEVFLDPGHRHDNDTAWHHFIVSASGAILDERGPMTGYYSTGDPMGGDQAHNAAGFRAEVERTDTGWRAVLTIPWGDLGGAPRPGDAWGLNLNRTEHPRGAYLCWSPTYGLFFNIHQWGHIVFVGDDPANWAAEEQRGREQLTMQHDTLERNITRKAEYIERVTRGEGFMPWQDRAAASPEERAFRDMIEQRKTDLLANRMPVQRPAMFTAEQLDRARRNIEQTEWGRARYERIREVADHIVAQDEGYIERMISELTPTTPYGITCPNCVGRLTQEGANAYGGFTWDYREPDIITCDACGQTLPDAKFPEEGRLVCPRMGQTFTYYLTPAQQTHPEDRSGVHAWKWVGSPTHVSYEGILREKKAGFMLGAARQLALVYTITGEPRYAEAAARILQRLAHCYRGWLYHDYRDTYADCDPLYAAWHDGKGELPLEWKRNPSGMNYKNDDHARAGMNQTYFGAGRWHPSCDAVANHVGLCEAYDLVHNATDASGEPIWTDESRALVERDLLLERMMTGEHWLGGHLKAESRNNKAGRVYCAVAAIGVCLGLPDYADTALRGYELLRDESFISDGFSRESAFYTFDGFLAPLIHVPEMLHGFAWPDDYKPRAGVVDVYGTDPKLRLIFHAMHDSVRPDGRHIPFADTREPYGPQAHLLEIGLKRYPDLFAGKVARLRHDRPVTEYALFNLDAEQLERRADFTLPEVLFPDWKSAMLRHGSGEDVAVLALTFNDWGIHMHTDSLGIYYRAGGHTILGDQGYISDSPMGHWIHTTFSHNLVIVDDQAQPFAPTPPRRPSLRMMVTSPLASVVEAASNAYPDVKHYRRLIALLKGPEGHTFAVDIFRVREGGTRHAWRVFSELAANDAAGSAREFVGIDMPAEPEVPNFGGSTAREHIFGLRDVRRVTDPPSQWQAIWRQDDRQYRLHVLADAAAVQASHGPGQEDESQTGRRVRYLDVIREGDGLASTFVAIHEPSVGKRDMPIKSVERLPVDDAAGPDAIALRIESDWGTYLLLNAFDNEATIDGVRFEGAFGLLRVHPDGRRELLAHGARTMLADGWGFENAPAHWQGRVVQHTDDTITTDTPRPPGWNDAPAEVGVYVRTGDGETFTGYPLAGHTPNTISIERFPLLPATHFDLAATRYKVVEAGD